MPKYCTGWYNSGKLSWQQRCHIWSWQSWGKHKKYAIHVMANTASCQLTSCCTAEKVNLFQLFLHIKLRRIHRSLCGARPYCIKHTPAFKWRGNTVSFSTHSKTLNTDLDVTKQILSYSSTYTHKFTGLVLHRQHHCRWKILQGKTEHPNSLTCQM